ncbi:MAG: hypothetical protein AB7S75_15620, partial [Desulfococcaceae bacterium]
MKHGNSSQKNGNFCISSCKLQNSAAMMLRFFVILFTIVALFLAAQVPDGNADPFPPIWNGNTPGTAPGTSLHYQVAMWPDAAAGKPPTDLSAWTPTYHNGNTDNDPRVGDPSNGGTRPQNYVNVASGCPTADKSLPSIYWAFDSATQTIFFRWRVEQIANTYATGPSPGSFSSGDPWNAALWTVFFDIDGDGFREFAVHLDGSGGSPSTPIDLVAGIYSNTRSQSIDYENDPNIHRIAHNPTAFVGAGNILLNYHSSLAPDTSWPNGSNETVWDYGTTRSVEIIDTPQCVEYFVDYQIPLGLLDASGVDTNGDGTPDGPKITENTPLSMFFTTANSLNNALQKDAVIDASFTPDLSRELPFGDFITLANGTLKQPIVDVNIAAGCGPVEITSQIVKDALVVSGQTSVETTVDVMEYRFYFDANGDGFANDGGTWDKAVPATNDSSLGPQVWTATWDSSGFEEGQYLVGVYAVDNKQGYNQDLVKHVTFSYLTDNPSNPYYAYSEHQLPVSSIPGEVWYANPDPDPGVQMGTFVNTCGTTAISKTSDKTEYNAGGLATFTITIKNTLRTELDINSITDSLPSGFIYAATTGGTLSPSTSPAAGATGDITWTFSPAVTIPAAAGDPIVPVVKTLVFTANVSGVSGTYTNVVSASATRGTTTYTMTADPLPVGVGAPLLNISKSAVVSTDADGDGKADPGTDTITYTISYSNDSPVNVPDVIITDTVPAGLTYVPGSASNGGTEAGGTITWNVGDLASGEGPYTVTFQATVNNPYPDAEPLASVNTATIDDDNNPASVVDSETASTTVLIDAPRPNLVVQKSAGSSAIVPGGSVTFTISYMNTGNVAATGVIITDDVPTGFTYVSNTGGGSYAAPTVTWNIGTVAAGGTGSVTVTMQTGNPFTGSNPTTNTATIDSNETTQVSDSVQVGVTSGGGGSTCSGPTSGTDTSGSSFTPSNVATESDGLSDEYSAPTGYNESLYQQYNFSSFGATSVPSDVQLTLVYDEKKINGVKIDVYGNGSLLINDYGLTWNDTPSATAHTINNVDLDTVLGRSFTVDEINNLVIYLWASASGSGDGFYTDYVNVCVITPPDPANLIINKQASALSVSPNGTLTYTINYANTGGGTANNIVITDTLPAATMFSSATGGGTHAGGVVTWNIASLAAGTGGSVTVKVDVTTEATGTLDNTASIDSDETTPVSDTTSTIVKRPNVTINKSADSTLLFPGDTVLYTLTVLNSGDAEATVVIINDVLPTDTYFTYDSAYGTKLDGAAHGDPINDNKTNIGTLAAGATAKVTFQMIVAGAGVPAGTTTKINSATVQNNETTGTRSSDPVIVTISSNPNLVFDKTVSPAGPHAPGDTLTYTLTVTNEGASSAADVIVEDTIPDYTTYQAGSLKYNGAARTDTKGAPDDNAYYDSAYKKTVFDIGTLGSGVTVILQFQVKIDSTMPVASTTITNSATVSSSNTSGRTDTTDSAVNASPVLTIDKSGPASVPYPVTKVSSVSDATHLVLSDVSSLTAGQYIRVDTDVTQITDISGNTVTVSPGIAAVAGEDVVGSLTYILSYTNTGATTATNISVKDTLPAGAVFVNASTGCLEAAGVVTCAVGDLKVGYGGSVQVTIFPGSTGPHTDIAKIFSDEQTTDPAIGDPRYDDLATTAAGIVENPVIGIAKTASVARSNGDGTYTTGISIIVKNLGNVVLNNVQVTDNLNSAFPNPAIYTVANLTASMLTLNDAPVFNGNTNQNLLKGTDVLGVGETGYISFDVTFNPNGSSGPFNNSATGTGTSPGGTTSSDISDNGTNPDPDDDGSPNEAGENDPTPIKFSSLGIAKQAGQAVDNGDGTYTSAITIYVENLSATEALTYLQVTDDLSATFAAPASVVEVTGLTSVTLTVNAGFNGTSDTRLLAGTDTLGAGANATITFNVKFNPGASAGPFNNSAVGQAQASSGVHTDTSDDGTNPDPDNDGNADEPGENDPTPITMGKAVLSAEKSDALHTDADGNGYPSPGDTIAYTAVIENTGTLDATGVVFTDIPDINTNLVATSVSTSQGTVSKGNTAGDKTVEVAVGTIAPAASVTITFRVTVKTPFPAGVNRIENQGWVRSTELPDEPTDDPDTPTVKDPTGTTVTAVPYIEADKGVTLKTDADGNGVPSPGDTLSYTVTIANSGNTSAAGVSFADTVPVNTTYVPSSLTSTQGTVNDGSAPNLSVTIGTLNAGAFATVKFDVTINSPLPGGVTQVANQGTVTADGGISVPTNDPVTPEKGEPTVTTVTAVPNINALKSDSLFTDADGNGVPSEGDTLSYRVVIANTGNAPAENVVFTDTPDTNAPLAAGSVKTGQGTVVSGNTAGDTSVNVTVGTVIPGASVIITFNVEVADPLPAGVTAVSNQGNVTADGGINVPTDDPDTGADDDPTLTNIFISIIDAADDDFTATPVNGLTGGDTASVLDNDTLNGAVFDPADVTLTPGTAPTPASGSITMNADGTITVASNTSAGTYVYLYTICEVVTPSNCDTAQATVVVTPPGIDAVDDSFGPVNGLTGATTAESVLNNDTLNGAAVDPAAVTLTPGTAPSPVAGSIVMNADGTITVAPDTTAGTYVYPYTVCEILNPSNCDSAQATVTVVPAVIDAVDDSFGPVNGLTGATTAESVLNNDTLNGALLDPAAVTLTPGTAPSPVAGSIVMNADGTITVAPDTTAGTYVYPYTVCEILNPSNCDSAQATVTVAPPGIDAVDDSFGPVNGLTGATTAESVLNNDTLNGAAVDPAAVTLMPGTAPAPAAGSITMNADGTITVAPGTTAGTYVYPYTICEILNPANCDTAQAEVVVAPPVIDAADDSFGPVNGLTGATTAESVLNNDTLNGAAVDPAAVTLTPGTAPSPAAGSIVMNADGTITVAPDTTGGIYVYPYTICEILNPSNCDTAQAEVVVAPPVIDAADDSFGPVNGLTGATTAESVLNNDTLNGAAVDPAAVTLTPGTAPAPAAGSISMNADGTITVAPNTTAGTYVYPYTVCEILNPSNCDSADLTVTVVTIDAVNDAGTAIDGTAGGTSLTSVLANDSLNGTSPVVLTDVNLTEVSSTHTGVTLDVTDGSVDVAAGTPDGNYTVTYQICDKLNSTICDTATVTVTVAAIDAVNDTGSAVNGAAGGTSLSNVLANDSLNGTSPVNLADVNLTQEASTHAGVTLDTATGAVNVAPGTPNGNYTVTYQICDKANLTICDTATVTVPVEEVQLTSTKSVSDEDGGNVEPGDTLLYTVVIKNESGFDVANAVFTDDIPAHTSYVAASVSNPSGSTVVSHTPTLRIENITLPANGQVSLTFRVQVDNPLAAGVTEIVNQGTVSYDANGDGTNDSSQQTDGDTVTPGEQPTVIPVTAGPNFGETAKGWVMQTDADNNGSVTPGDTIRYTVTIPNTGTQDASGVEFADSIPVHTVYVADSVNASGGTAVYSSTAKRIEWTGDVAAGSSVTIGFDVIVDSGIAVGTVLYNQGAVKYDSDGDGTNDGSEDTDGNPSDPGDQPTETPTGIPYGLAIKSVSDENGGNVEPGDILLYTVELKNQSGFDVAGLEFVDAIPANTAYVAASVGKPSGSTVVTETPTLRIQNIAVPAHGQVTVTFRVQLSTPLPAGVNQISNQGTVNYDSNGDGINDRSQQTDGDTVTPGEQPTVIPVTA